MNEFKDDNDRPQNVQPRFKFDKKLSWDGVAIIIGVISAFVWIGELRETIKELGTQSASHTQQLNEVSHSVSDVKSDVAVLRAVIEERTSKSVK